jgi:uncharacterized protein YoxC
MDKTVSEQMQDELEPIMHDESDDIEKTKKVVEDIKKKMSERGWVFHMDKGPGAEF